MAKKKLLYVQTSGVNTPQRLYSPFILAQTALAMNVEPTIYFLGEGVTVVKKGEAEKIKIGNFPSLKDVIDETLRQGIKLLICQQSAQLFGEKLTPDDFVDGSKVVGAATLNNLVLEADGTMWF
ncbi:MAG: DsrE family protein [Candidatus Hydromicrobium sp.]|jgi:predicted peroxiredoxin|nr:DsrE family protein [Actinomycetota bacterium]MDP3012301.1 DsrE family protein [Candidatus Hydromicrobium sp.]